MAIVQGENIVVIKRRSKIKTGCLGFLIRAAMFISRIVFPAKSTSRKIESPLELSIVKITCPLGSNFTAKG